MIRRTTINFLQRVISYLESTLVEKPKARSFELSHEDQGLISEFLQSTRLTESDLEIGA